MDATTPILGGGATSAALTRIPAGLIQRLADRYKVRIILIGSRASGKNRRSSDFDYIIEGNARIRKAVKFLLPRGPKVGDGPGIDLVAGPLDRERPHMIFMPQSETSS